MRKIPSELLIDANSARKKLVSFVREKVHAAHFTRVVVGISGGVDSAATAYICARALGNLSVLGLIMPYGRVSDKKSLNLAGMVVKELGIRHEIIDITPMVDAYFRNLPRADNIRRGNKMARERMSILYDKAKEFNALVVGTGNKTEVLLGYFTRHGDAACDINPLACLYKMQVYQLAKELGVPGAIIDRVPSAGLWPGQTDEGELGFKYSDVDRLLYYMIDKKFSKEKLIKIGFGARFIDKVKSKIAATEFKRQPAITPTIWS